MAKEVVLTPIAEEDFYNVLNYLTLKWGDAAVNNFVDRFEKVISLLGNDASIYPFLISLKIYKDAC